MTSDSDPTTSSPAAGTTNTSESSTGTAAPADAAQQSGWMVFDRTTSEFVDLPPDHPIHTRLQAAAAVTPQATSSDSVDPKIAAMLEQSTPIDDAWLRVAAADEAYARAVADAADMARLVRRYRDFLASPDGAGFTESEYAEFVAARLPDPDVWPDLDASLTRLEDTDALYNAYYPQPPALSPAADPSQVRDTGQTEDDIAVASSATELDQQWWNDRAHDTSGHDASGHGIDHGIDHRVDAGWGDR